MEKQFDASEVLADLDAGIFMQKVSSALAGTSLATCEHRRKGKVVLEFEMKTLGDSNQVILSHTVKIQKPTRRGSLKEDDTTSTPIYVGPRGAMSIIPFNQTDLFKEEQEEPLND